MTDIRDFASEFGQRVLRDTINELGDTWGNLSEAEKNLVARCAKRMGEMQLAKLAGNGLDEREWAHCEAQLLNIRSAAEGRVKGALLAVLRKAVQAVLSFLGSR